MKNLSSDDLEAARHYYSSVNHYLGVNSVSSQEIQFLETKPTPLVIQVPLVEYFERIKRHKADCWQINFCNRLQHAAENRHIKRDWTLYHAEAQLGKTTVLSQCFPAWLIGHDPLFRFSLAMYNVSRSQSHSQVVIQILQSTTHKDIFPDQDGHLTGDVSKAGWMTRGRRELNDGQVSFNPVGLQSGLTGAGFDWLSIDDPYKESKEAFSVQVRENMANFWNYTVLGRAAQTSCITGMFHRYAPEDFAGFLLDTEDFDYVRYASEADGDYVHESTGARFPDPLNRQLGELISPTRRPASYYDKVRRNKRVWLSMFQGRPSSEEGDFFNTGQIKIISHREAAERLAEAAVVVRVYDNAATKDAGDYSVGSKISINALGKITFHHVWRKQVDSARRLSEQRQLAVADGSEVVIRIPQDPGSAGKFEAWATEQQLEGFTVVARTVSGSKQVRAINFAAAVNAGDVEFADDSDLEASEQWIAAAKRELRDFPLSSHDDFVDTASDGYNYLYETSRKGLVVKNFRPQRNIVTNSAFGNLFLTGADINRIGITALIPAKWTIYAAVKISSEASKATSAVIVARAPSSSNLPETLFVVAEYKEYNSDFYRLFDWLDATLRTKIAGATKDNTTIYLHPDSEQYLVTIAKKLDFKIGVFKGNNLAGISELNWYLLPKEAANPFNRMEKAAGIYLLVDDEQFDAPTGNGGLYSIRQEMRTWGYDERGEPTKIGQILDLLRMITHFFKTYSEPLTIREEFINLLPENARLEPGQQGMTIQQQMNIQMQELLAVEKLREKYGLDEDEQLDWDD